MTTSVLSSKVVTINFPLNLTRVHRSNHRTNNLIIVWNWFYQILYNPTCQSCCNHPFSLFLMMQYRLCCTGLHLSLCCTVHDSTLPWWCSALCAALDCSLSWWLVHAMHPILCCCVGLAALTLPLKSKALGWFSLLSSTSFAVLGNWIWWLKMLITPNLLSSLRKFSTPSALVKMSANCDLDET